LPRIAWTKWSFELSVPIFVTPSGSSPVRYSLARHAPPVSRSKFSDVSPDSSSPLRCLSLAALMAATRSRNAATFARFSTCFPRAFPLPPPAPAPNSPARRPSMLALDAHAPDVPAPDECALDAPPALDSPSSSPGMLITTLRLLLVLRREPSFVRLRMS